MIIQKRNQWYHGFNANCQLHVAVFYYYLIDWFLSIDLGFSQVWSISGLFLCQANEPHFCFVAEGMSSRTRFWHSCVGDHKPYKCILRWLLNGFPSMNTFEASPSGCVPWCICRVCAMQKWISGKGKGPSYLELIL